MKYYRTLCRVISVRANTVELYIPGFDPYFYMSFPKSIFEENILKEINKNLYMQKECYFICKRSSTDDPRELNLIEIEDFLQPELTDLDF